MIEKHEEEPKTNRPETRLPDILSSPDVQKYVYDYYRDAGKEYYARMAIYRWGKGTRYPSVGMLAEMAKISGTNLEYILGLTDSDCACEFFEPPVKRTLQELLDASSMTEKDLANALNGNYRSVHLYKESLPVSRISSLIKISKAVHLSIDYILGYTDWETWELRSDMHRPFHNIKPGSGIYIVADKNVRSKADVEDAIKRGDGMDALLSLDGERVLFPNGANYSVHDEMFTGTYITTTKPEVK